MYVGILIAALVGGYLIYDNFIKPTPSGTVGIQAGNILLDETITSVDGVEKIKFSDYRGKVLIIDFMAPWCAPCKAEFQELKVVESIEGVEVVTINVDPSYDMEFLIEFGQDEGLTWFLGHSPEAALDYEVTGIPTVLVVDQEGYIVHRGYYTSVQDFQRILPDLID
jgi:thiol-disulfide isomerase/thioredoxin